MELESLDNQNRNEMGAQQEHNGDCWWGINSQWIGSREKSTGNPWFQPAISQQYWTSSWNLSAGGVRCMKRKSSSRKNWTKGHMVQKDGDGHT